MAPEELEAAREYRAMLPPNGTRALNILLGNLLAHIDAQAAQISDLKRQIITLSDSVVSVESRKDRQIEAMKEKLVEQLAKYFVLQQAQCTFRTPIKGSMMSKCDKGVICDWNVCPIKDEWEEQARQQLKAEMPEVEWE